VGLSLDGAYSGLLHRCTLLLQLLWQVMYSYDSIDQRSQCHYAIISIAADL